jgi:rRNA biogenesis protein RRP5
MAPAIKRKAGADERPLKKAKSGKVEDEKKVIAKGLAKAGKPGKAQEDTAGERKPVAKTVLSQEERAFPRGGASVLTPIEQKQIEARAERDVLFEQQTGQKPVRREGDDDFFSEDDEAAAPKSGKNKKGKKSSGLKIAGSGIKIQSLSYKNLIVGSTVLGRVTAITGKDVALALPNNLTGYVPITAVSARLNDRIEKLLREEDTKKEEDDDENDADIDLKKLFYQGQWIRATVTGTGSESADKKAKRHIELSVDPVHANGGLESENVVVNSTIQASVRSVEDHGIIMDLGLAEADVKGFVSKKELGAAYTLEDVQEGQVMLCLVTGKGSNGKVLKLCPDAAKFSVVVPGQKTPIVATAPVVDAFLPGTAVDVLITETTAGGVAGKIIGMLNATADFAHSGASMGVDPTEKYKVNTKTKARIIWALPGDEEGRKVGISLLDSVLTMPPAADKLAEATSAKLKALSVSMAQALPNSSIIEDATISHVLADRGIYLTLPATAGIKALAFAHISQVSDARIDSLSSSTGAYKVDSTHKVRILGYNPVDNVYYVSLKQSILDQTFLRLEDLVLGEVVKGSVERLILGGSKGVTGILVKLSDSISGLVPEMHMSDVQLQHPERKYREGFPITVRVLSVDFEKRHVRLTLKKSLVADKALPIWSDYSKLEPDMESKGTIVNIKPNGAVVQFFGSVRAWLPIAEMSEGYVQQADRHFRVGQTVTARILSLDASAQEMKVSCKSGEPMDEEQVDVWNKVQGGEIVTATVTEKTADSVSVDLENGLKGMIRVAHLVDASAAKAENALKRIRVGQKLTDLLILDKLPRTRQVLLTNKPGLVEAAKGGKLIKSFADVIKGAKVNGFVRNVTPEGVYIEFANGVVGLALKSQLSPEMLTQAAFGLRKDQSIAPHVLNVDADKERFLLTMREPKDTQAPAEKTEVPAQELVNPVDPSISTSADLTLNRVVKARIASIKGTQINVRLADNTHGRIDASEAYDSWDEFKNKKAPLQQFKQNDLLDVKILGLHDSRNHRFLPISHRHSKNPVFELSAKKSRVEGDNTALLGGLEGVTTGGEYMAFVNNHGDDCVWVNLSPSVRGRVALMDLSDDAGLLGDVVKNFPIGSALMVKVKNVMPLSNRLDLSAKLGEAAGQVTLDNITPGSVIAGRVTKTTERFVTVQLSDSLAAPVSLPELSDDFDQADPTQYNKNDIVRVCVLDVDIPNKKLSLSLRPSKVLSSSLPVKDAQIPNLASLKSGDLVRGFVKHVSDKGVIVSLSGTVDAFVRIADLSDQYIKDWKSLLQIDQLVRGRIMAVDAAAKHIQLSLKASHADPNFTAPLKMDDIKTGMIVTGKVRKVEDFGAFIDIDNTVPRLSGLCHRSEIADKRVADVRKIYESGDNVKAIVLKVNAEEKKISLGLKASYFKDNVDVDMDDDDDDEVSDAESGGVDVGADDDEDVEMEDDLDLDDVEDMDSEDEGVRIEQAESSDDSDDEDAKPSTGLATTGFDWTGNSLNANAKDVASDSEGETSSKKRKRSKKEIKVDMTADLDKDGPRNTSDFERLLLGQPNESGLWIQYMAFQLQLGEVQKAREVAERALRTIHIRELDEKANVWIAWINLEVEYGEEERVEEVFKRACQVQEPLGMHEKLASIYIDSGKHDKADAVFERIVANKAFRASPDVWLNYATFLMTSKQEPDRARALLPRSLKSVPTSEHRLLTAKFAGLEFRSAGGDAERGRTIFETIVGEWPKWTQGWDMWADLERAQISAAADSADAKKEAVEKTRGLFERMCKAKMKKRRAKFVFKRWMEFEEKEGGKKEVERVQGIAKEWVERAQAKAGDEDDEE